MLSSLKPTAQSIFLAGLLGGTLLALGKVSLTPAANQNTRPSTPNYPQNISLTNWQLQDSQVIVPESEAPKFTGKRYRYHQGNQTLTIAMRYMPGGNTAAFLKSTAKLPPATITRYQPQVGHYSLLTHDQTAYLSACLNPAAQGTVTYAQFNQIRYASLLQPAHWWRWFLGQTPLRASGCHWALLALPLQDQPATAAYATLEAVWPEWVAQWRPQSPDRP